MTRFDNEGHTIYFGDALEILRKEIDDDSIDLVFLDPPYNIGKRFSNFRDRWPSEHEYCEWAKKWLDECIRVLKPHGSMYLMTSTQAMPHLDIYLRNQMVILSRIIWSYDSSGVQAKKYYGSMYEPILHCVKKRDNYTFNADDILVEAKTGAKRNLIDYRGDIPKPYNTQKVPGNVWYIPRVRYRMEEYEKHPSQKPETLLNRIILASSNSGDTVLDPFSGTFTTAAVAKSLGRNSVSIESQEEFLKVGLRRVLGLNAYNGEALDKPIKSTKRKNFKGHKCNSTTGDLFNDYSEA